MTQLVINIEDASVKATLKQALLKVMSNFKGVSFEEEDSYTLDDALEEVRRGSVTGLKRRRHSQRHSNVVLNEGLSTNFLKMW